MHDRLRKLRKCFMPSEYHDVCNELLRDRHKKALRVASSAYSREEELRHQTHEVNHDIFAINDRVRHVPRRTDLLCVVVSPVQKRAVPTWRIQPRGVISVVLPARWVEQPIARP